MKRHFKNALILLIATMTIMGISMPASAATKLSSFYTDESGYYQKLFSTGMVLRFSLNSSECDKVFSA